MKLWQMCSAALSSLNPSSSPLSSPVCHPASIQRHETESWLLAVLLKSMRGPACGEHMEHSPNVRPEVSKKDPPGDPGRPGLDSESQTFRESLSEHNAEDRVKLRLLIQTVSGLL